MSAGFPDDITMALTGVTKYQLRNWRSTNLLTPEVNAKRPALYSFRDLVALRTVSRLRADTSLQKIRKAFGNLAEFNLTDHPSTYKFAVSGTSIAVWTDDGFMDIVKHPGQYDIYSLEDIYRPFRNRLDELVVDFEKPRRSLRVDARRLGGWPTIDGTRVPYDTIANAVSGANPVSIKSLRQFYPGVTPAAVADALDFAQDIEGRKIG